MLYFFCLFIWISSWRGGVLVSRRGETNCNARNILLFNVIVIHRLPLPLTSYKYNNWIWKIVLVSSLSLSLCFPWTFSVPSLLFMTEIMLIKKFLRCYFFSYKWCENELLFHIFAVNLCIPTLIFVLSKIFILPKINMRDRRSLKDHFVVLCRPKKVSKIWPFFKHNPVIVLARMREEKYVTRTFLSVIISLYLFIRFYAR